MKMFGRPSLRIDVTYLHERDRDAAIELGEVLYDHLCDGGGWLASPGIPVGVGIGAAHVDVTAADRVVIVPVLGKRTFETRLSMVQRTLSAWASEGAEIVAVASAKGWDILEETIEGVRVVRGRLGKIRRKTLDALVMAAARALAPDGATPKLYLSHAGGKRSKEAVEAIGDAVRSPATFFDARIHDRDLRIEEALDRALDSSVLVVVRTDDHGGRRACQRELLRAKACRIPTLTVDVVERGEARVFAYGGNGPSLVWTSEPRAIVGRAMVEYLRALCFRAEAARLVRAASLPDDVVTMMRAPELLDLAQGPIPRDRPVLVMHPDPELSVHEHRLLRTVHPSLGLATPTTAFRQLLGRSLRPAVQAPLAGRQIALSLSNTPDVDGPAGFTKRHVDEAIVLIAQSLIANGASLAYGGDFRQHGYTHQLASLIDAYAQTAAERPDLLHSYIAANISPDAGRGETRVHHMSDPEEGLERRVEPPAPGLSEPKSGARSALCYSDMRRAMTGRVEARIVLGGQSRPQTAGSPGYLGRYPGVVEEAWRALEVGQPVYVVGGFGGAAGLVAKAIAGADAIEGLSDATWMDDASFRERARAIDADDDKERLGLPATMDAMATAIHELARPFFASDSASRTWNGLTLEQNALLMRSRDPIEISALIMKGLLEVLRPTSADVLDVELVYGTVTDAMNLDAIAVATFEDVPLGGAGHAIDQVLQGRVSAEHARGRQLVAIGTADIDANWLFLASLGDLGDEASVDDRIRAAVAETVQTARQQGFSNLGVVQFGGALRDAEHATDAMIEGLSELAGSTSIVWFENDESEFGRLRAELGAHEGVRLTTRIVASARTLADTRPEPLVLHVVVTPEEQLEVSILPPGGGPVAGLQRWTLDKQELARLVAGVGPSGRMTPDLDVLDTRGRKLAERLLGRDARALLEAHRTSRIEVVHDASASRIPFELLAVDTDDAPLRPSIHPGLIRRLRVEGTSVLVAPNRPERHGKLRVLLVVNPTSDLESAASEADEIRRILDGHPNVDLRELEEGDAEVAAVREGLQTADVLHYIGHAFFEGTGDDTNGLILADGNLTVRELGDVAPLPRIAFVNACESARVRGRSPPSEPAAFAEVFLCAGVDAYLGTYWEVGDAAASGFAAGVYTQLAVGYTLEAAVQNARSALLLGGERDWANYVLYGDGRFRLRTRDEPEDDALGRFAEVNAAAAEEERATRFNGGEHMWLGRQGMLQACANLGVDSAPFGRLKRRTARHRFSYGEIVALSGDFYRTPKDLFEETPARLPWLPRSNDLDGLVKVFEKEIDWIENAGGGARPYPDKALALVWSAKHYVELALDNDAHFGWHNMKAYVDYHTQALQLAIAAGDGDDDETWRRAIFYNAFADHFLTDGFAAGHVRVPRREIRDWCRSTGWTEGRAGLLSKVLHDQDGHVDLEHLHAHGEAQDDAGLFVANAAGVEWHTRCDGQLFLRPADEERGEVVRQPVAAVRASVEELLRAREDKALPTGIFRATLHVPFPHPDGERLVQKFPASIDSQRLRALAQSLSWLFRTPFTKTRVGERELRALFQALPDLMKDLRAAVAKDIDDDPKLSQRLPRAYLHAFRTIEQDAR